ncbi:MAG: hypothetical protein A3G18_00540 [Rhodospirillales bacterium RIFCSPLOWO2_12_FULL_58_28]|nr:MAG: hypothetical protein A3H92_05475 [Rhodospirillales bacterium RIFCSPLOWO2_02_FULL_58_16]OHC77024.1 MAG: hypothetical protein A3G18_00540 [Rhodospirillales bacterium RIFCSPLOWO2_12_FULL_58_28]
MSIVEKLSEAGGKRRHFLSFIMPFLSVLAVEYFITGRGYLIGKFDALAFMFCAGTKGTAITTYHHPGYLTQEIGSFLVFLSGADGSGEAVDRFFVLGILFIILMVFLCGWISAALAERGRIPWFVTLCLSVIMATMPAMAAFSTIFNNYIIYGLLLVPLSIGLYAVLAKKENDLLVTLSTFFLFGLATSLLYISIVFAIPVALVLAADFIFTRRDILSKRFAGECPPPTERALLIVAVIAVFLLTFEFSITAYGYFQSLEPDYLFANMIAFKGLIWKSWVIILIPGAFTAWGMFWSAKISEPSRLFVTRAFGPSLLGFLVGANVYSHSWISTGLIAYKNQGGLKNAGWETYLQALPVNGLTLQLGLCLIVALTVGVHGLIRRNDRAFIFAALAVMGISINIIIGAPKVAGEAFSSINTFGLKERLFISSMVCLMTFLVWMSKTTRRWLNFTLLIAISGIGIVSYFLEYIQGNKEFIREATAVNREVEETIATYLGNNPDGAVFCIRDEIAETCYRSYAYNRCYLGASAQGRKEADWWTHGGKVRFAATVDEAFEAVRTGGYKQQWPDHGLFIGAEQKLHEYARKKIVSRNGIEASLVALPK